MGRAYKINLGSLEESRHTYSVCTLEFDGPGPPGLKIEIAAAIKYIVVYGYTGRRTATRLEYWS